MELSIHDVARLLSVPEKQVRNWLRYSGLPSYSILDQYRFNRDEILEWAATHHLPVSMERPYSGLNSETDVRLSKALHRGGIFFDLPGATMPEVFHALLDRIHLHVGADRELLHQMLMAREAANPTGVGAGVAIPHVKNPIIVPIEKPIAAIGFLRVPIEWNAPDCKPVFCLFTLLCSSVPQHLSNLARIANVLHHEEFQALMRNCRDGKEILSWLETWESRSEKAPTGP